MKVGDLIAPVYNGAFYAEGVGIVLEEPSLSADCMPGGEGYPNETYYTLRALFADGIHEIFEEDCEVINESR